MSNHQASPEKLHDKLQEDGVVPATHIDGPVDQKPINPEQFNGHADDQMKVVSNGDIENGKLIEEENKDKDVSPRRHSRSPSFHSGRHSRERHHHRSRSDSRRSSRSGRGRHPVRSDRSRSPERRSGHGDDQPIDKEYTQIYVARISRNCTADDLQSHFAQFGPIREVVMKGKYAFIDYESPKDAGVAVIETNGKPFKGFDIVVEQSVPGGGKRRRTTGPQKEDECWKCGKTGHWQNDCRARGSGRDSRGGGRRRSGSRGRRSYSRERRPAYRGDRGGRKRSGSRGSFDDGRSKELREGRCFQCGDKGHIRRNCPDSRGGKPSGNRFGGNDRRDRDRNYGGGRRYSPSPRASRSRSRSYPKPSYRRGGGNTGAAAAGGRRDYTPSRSPPRRRDYSRSRSPRRSYRNRSRSPSYN